VIRRSANGTREMPWCSLGRVRPCRCLCLFPALVHGGEILNDNKTPMDFVFTVLMNHAAQNWKTSENMMREVHSRGGVLFLLPIMLEAEQMARAITAEAKGSG
jgi:hypothetical protein